MKKNIQNLFLYISAFIPMYFLILLNLILEIINGNLSFNVLNTTMLIMLSLLIFLGIFGLFWTIKFNGDKTIKVKIIEKKNTTDQHFLGYFSLFVLFALSFELEKVSYSCVFVVILVFVGIVYIHSGLYYINPFLNILGFNFYDITYQTENDEKLRTAKIFYRGYLELDNRTYYVNLKNDNFCFLDKKRNSKK